VPKKSVRRLRLVEERQEGAEFEVRGGIPPFTSVKNEHLDLSKLSMKAMGLLCYMLSKPPGWRFSSSRIANEAIDGITAIRSAQRELQSAGILEVVNMRHADGTFYKKVILHADRAFGNLPKTHRG
jgi:hypothetical protein